MPLPAQKARARFYSHGLVAEFLAILFLTFKGYRILKHRLKTPWGEIDLLAVRGNTLVCVEVKKRSSVIRALESVSSRQRGRLARSVLWYMQKHRCLSMPVRFDVVCWQPWGWPHHVPNAWQTEKL
jgi:putative endonuclease